MPLIRLHFFSLCFYFLFCCIFISVSIGNYVFRRNPLCSNAIISIVCLFLCCCSQRPSNNKASLSYKDSGVDIDAGDNLVQLIKPMSRGTQRPGVMGGLGGFGGLFRVKEVNEINTKRLLRKMCILNITPIAVELQESCDL